MVTLKDVMGGVAGWGRRSVMEKTFAAGSAEGREVVYITERAVFRLHAGGIELLEVAPGIDVDRDVLAHMDFAPILGDVKRMDPRIFTAQ